MKKEELALEIIERLKKNTRMRSVLWIIMRPGNCWSACVWQRSVRMHV